ncbi:Uncharacterised protein [Chlamydia trachomatis]|nr:Uncharacterised protein [Chlamydia trachomatis]
MHSKVSSLTFLSLKNSVSVIIATAKPSKTFSLTFKSSSITILVITCPVAGQKSPPISNSHFPSKGW